jgi:GGDEF domain-containing protein
VEQAHRGAERLRVAVADASMVAGVQLTMSFGVSASKRGSAFDYDEVFAVADAALYEAKRGGRDQVVSGAKEAQLVA